MTKGITRYSHPSPRVLELVEWIYPQAREAIEQASRSGFMKSCLYQNRSGQEGAFCLIEKENFLLGYLSFSEDLPEWDWKDRLKSEVEQHIPDPPGSEFCFNLYGRNPRAIQYIQSLGFRLDMHGMVMRYARGKGGEPPTLPVSSLKETGLLPDRIGDYCELLDAAYLPQNQAIGWKTDWYSSHPAAAFEKLSAYDHTDSLRSYWSEHTLVGVCLTDGPYLSELAVHPQFQNQGNGSNILARCIRRLLVEKSYPEIRMRVALSNAGAVRLFRRFGFEEIGCFADHTYTARKEDHAAQPIETNHGMS